MNEKQFLRMPLLMKEVRVSKSKVESQKGLKGKIIEETKNTFTIKTNEKKIKIIKETSQFEFNNEGQKITVEGKTITKRPTERITMKIK